MKRQRGLATLLVTVMLLVVSLIFSLSSYKNIFYQIKRTQNEVMARKAHWLAEGGLECSFSKVMLEPDLSVITNPNYFDSTCNFQNLNLSISSIALNSYKVLSATELGSARANIQRNIVIGGDRLPGAIKATSDLILDADGGTFTFYPDPGKKAGDDYECVLMRYAGKVEIVGTVVNQGLDWNFPPYDGFHDDASSWPSCKSSHQSTVHNNEINLTQDKPREFGNDYQKISSQYDAFKDVFFTDRKNWQTVRDKSAIVVGSKECASDIANIIAKGDLRVWVEGNCDLGMNVSAIQESIDKSGSPGAVIVVQDGILAVNGSHKLDALIYHFKSPASSFMPTNEQWDQMSSGGDLSEAEKGRVAYFQNGSFFPSGGYVMDAPGLTAKIRGSVNFSFNGDVYQQALEDLVTIKWQEGSWHDF
ncbi:hypothetical protein BIZ37_13310 [Photobacterium sp. BZF1]|uniref:hypothetical protein n=1 Tax=Photobacterium sp. BZF1 TaxID=1904457 RepID=UPI0016539022|nr:hypothetical protein [Photobacterium sp. BZF1]MBC7003538.1 hypothetical protein [Photobacterium sp. BZF1]